MKLKNQTKVILTWSFDPLLQLSDSLVKFTDVWVIVLYDVTQCLRQVVEVLFVVATLASEINKNGPWVVLLKFLCNSDKKE